jgi:hypothetical protein
MRTIAGVGQVTSPARFKFRREFILRPLKSDARSANISRPLNSSSFILRRRSIFSGLAGHSCTGFKRCTPLFKRRDLGFPWLFGSGVLHFVGVAI